RREERVVEIGDRARRRVRREVRAQPLFLRRAASAAANLAAVRVERDQMPRSDVERVVSLRGVAGCRAEVGEVACALTRRVAVCTAGRVVLVVSGCRVGDRLYSAPGGVVRLRKRTGAVAPVLVVADGEDGGE